MVIELKSQLIISQIRETSHREVSSIADAEARYRVEAGTEKLADIRACLFDAIRRLKGRVIRFLSDEWMSENYIDSSDNSVSIPVSWSFEFEMTERRALGKTEPLAEAMNTFVLEYALSKFYSIVSMGDLSNTHSLAAVEAGNILDELLYTKLPPI